MFIIHSLDRRWHFQRLVRISIALAIHSLDRSLFTRLIAPYKTIAFAIRSVDCSYKYVYNMNIDDYRMLKRKKQGGCR